MFTKLRLNLFKIMKIKSFDATYSRHETLKSSHNRVCHKLDTEMAKVHGHQHNR